MSEFVQYIVDHYAYTKEQMEQVLELRREDELVQLYLDNKEELNTFFASYGITEQNYTVRL